MESHNPFMFQSPPTSHEISTLIWPLESSEFYAIQKVSETTQLIQMALSENG